MNDRSSQNEKISVVIPCFNNRRFIKKAIESAIYQTVELHELIICDDHSEDGSWDFLQSLRAELEPHAERVELIRQPENQGISRNINTGLKEAVGDWISILAGDDLFGPRKLEHERNAALQGEKKVAYSGVSVVDEEGREVERWRLPEPPPEGNVFVQTILRTFFQNQRGLYRNPLIHRSVYEQIGYLDESLEMYEDWDFKIRMAKHYEIVYSGICAVKYRFLDEGMHTTPARKKFHNKKRVIRKNAGYLSDLPSPARTRLTSMLDHIELRTKLKAELEEGKYFSAFSTMILSIFRYPGHPDFIRHMVRPWIPAFALTLWRKMAGKR